MAFTTWQLRRGTAGAWATAAAVLADGEIGYETGTGKFKIGDGSTGWASLAYFEAGSGGGGALALVKAKGNLSSASFQNVEADLVWATPVITDSDVSISGSEITINTDGTYKFTVTLRTVSNNRTELFIRTYFDTGSGFTQDTDAIVSDYVARDTDQDTGAVTLIDVFELTDGDKVEFRGYGDCDGTCVGLDAGTVLIIERLA